MTTEVEFSGQDHCMYMLIIILNEVRKWPLHSVLVRPLLAECLGRSRDPLRCSDNRPVWISGVLLY